MSLLRYFQNPYKDFEQSKSLGELRNDDELRRKLVNDITVSCHQVFQKNESQNCEGGVYVGPAGISYMYLHITRDSNEVMKVLTDNIKANHLKQAQKEIKANLDYRRSSSRSDLPAFLIGRAGVVAVAAIMEKVSGNDESCQKFLEEYSSYGALCQPLQFRSSGSDELFVGRAGYLCGALWLHSILGIQPVPVETLKTIWRSIVESGQTYSKQHKSPTPLMYAYYKTEYLGAAHGLCGILQILLSFPDFLQEFPESEQLIKSSIDSYLKLQDGNGNFPCALDEIGPSKQRSECDQLVHWCHGATGAIYLFAKAYLHYKDKKYLDVCIKAGELVWQQGLLIKGPGICHGISGSAYVFLVLYKLLGESKTDSKNLYRATKFYEFMETEQFKSEAKTPDCPYSLYEGLAGKVCFMADLLNPDQAEFPFFKI